MASRLLPFIAFLVEYGQLLIGLSLVSGLSVRASALFGILPMLFYWTAQMSVPFIKDTNSLLIDFQITDAVALDLRMLLHAGRAYGLDGLVAKRRMAEGQAALRWLAA